MNYSLLIKIRLPKQKKKPNKFDNAKFDRLVTLCFNVTIILDGRDFSQVALEKNLIGLFPHNFFQFPAQARNHALKAVGNARKISALFVHEAVRALLFLFPKQ